MAYDLLISNGTIVDGSGGARFDADVAVQGASVAAIGKLDRAAATVIDAAGKIVCPGFVDPHTHYDAQITWDPLLSSSAEHGVTTVVMGNCGVGIAPCRPAARDWLTDDLVTVEGIDKDQSQVVMRELFTGPLRADPGRDHEARAHQHQARGHDHLGAVPLHQNDRDRRERAGGLGLEEAEILGEFRRNEISQ